LNTDNEYRYRLGDRNMVRRAWWLVLTLAVVIGAQWLLARSHADVRVETERLAEAPVLHFAAVGEARGAVVVLHDLGGSKELMQCWGYGLARRGFDAYVPDLPGHGEQVAPLPQWEAGADAALGGWVNRLVAELLADGRAEPGKVGLLGQGLGADAALAAVQRQPAVAATILVFPSEPGTTGSPDRLVLAGNPVPGLCDENALAQAAAWLHQQMGTEPPAGSAAPSPLPWLLVSLAGGVGALAAASGLVQPRLARTGSRTRPTGLAAGLVAVAVALLSAVLAAVYWRLPQLGVALLDYLLPYFLVAAAVLLLFRTLWPREFGVPLLQPGEPLPAAVMRGVAVALAFVGAVVPVIHLNVTHFLPNQPRLLPLAAATLVFWLYAVQVEGLKRAVAGGPSPGGLALGLGAKLVMVATWVGAGVLPRPPALLAAVAPRLFGALVLLELVDWGLAAMRFSPVSIALTEAFILGWSAAVVLPLV